MKNKIAEILQENIEVCCDFCNCEVDGYECKKNGCVVNLIKSLSVPQGGA